MQTSSMDQKESYKDRLGENPCRVVLNGRFESIKERGRPFIFCLCPRSKILVRITDHLKQIVYYSNIMRNSLNTNLKIDPPIELYNSSAYNRVDYVFRKTLKIIFSNLQNRGKKWQSK
jgi:hypothetical protein